MRKAEKFLTKICGARSGATSSFVFLCLVCAPGMVGAQVVISEFLYDAAGSDTDQEWVELFNAGESAVDLTKWKINDGSNHVFNVPPKNDGKGSISIPSGGYLILASNAATFAAQYPLVANVIDTTLSLPNTSGSVSLVDESGATVDTLSYTKDMGAAGDSLTLHRATLAGTALSAAAPSPGSGSLSANAASTQSAATSTTESAQTTSGAASGNSSPVSSYVAPPLPQLFAEAGGDRVAIVGADVIFEGRAYNRNREFVDMVRFVWNFGDGSTAEGQSVAHHFEYPGRYVVWLDIAHDTVAASDRIIVTAEPARLSFTVFADGSAEIVNNAGRDLDLSNWVVANFAREFRLPKHSLILSGTSMRISQKTLGFWSGMQTELRYPNGALALRAGDRSETAVPVVAPPPTSPARVETRSAPVAAHSQSSSSVEQDAAPSGESAGASSPYVAAAAAGSAPSVWWFVVSGLGLSVAGMLVLVRYLKKNEWDIIEETAE